VHLEAEFIDAIVAYDQKYYADRGVKHALVTHPPAANHGDATGHFKNFRKRVSDGLAEEIADLHLLDAAEEAHASGHALLDTENGIRAAGFYHEQHSVFRLWLLPAQTKRAQTSPGDQHRLLWRAL